MSTLRGSHTATLLADGRILVIGGFRGDGANASTELRDPATGAFTASGALTHGRYFHTATLLSDGRVLVVGGSEDSTIATSSAELWDPATERFQDAGSLRGTRALHTATRLADGRVLIVGGLTDAEVWIAEAELWDPATGISTPAGTLAHRRGWHTATLLPDGRVLIVGGPDAAELWDPAAMSFHEAGTLERAGWWGTSTLLPDGHVLVVGGLGGDGYPGEGDAVDTAALWDPSTMTFSQAGSMTDGRGMHSATLLPDGRVLLVGGATRTTRPVPITGAESWDPATRSFQTGASLEGARAGHSATLLPDGKVVIIGGVGPDDRGLSTAEIWTP